MKYSEPLFISQKIKKINFGWKVGYSLEKQCLTSGPCLYPEYIFADLHLSRPALILPIVWTSAGGRDPGDPQNHQLGKGIHKMAS